MDRRSFVKSVSGIFLLSNFLSCDGNGPTDDDSNGTNGGNGNNNPPPTNKAPVTNSIKSNFRWDGDVEYHFSGTDSDGYIDYINVSVNNGSFRNLEEGYYTFPIIQGDNKVTARAYDNKGKYGSLITSSFYSPAEDEAKKFIENILIENKDKYNSLEKNVLMSVDIDKSFYVDFLIKKKDGTDAIVDYIGYNVDLKKQIENLDSLKWFGIPTLSLARFPENEINTQLNDFIRGF